MKSELTNQLEKFGISGLDINRILAVALKNGGSLAELFFENTQSTRISFESGQIDRIVDGIDRGVGLRILFDHRSVYGYSTELTQDALLGLAQTLSAAVSGKTVKKGSVATDWRLSRQPVSEIEQFKIKKSARELALKEKIAITQSAEKAAREELPQARQITSVWVDSCRQTLVINSDGLLSPTTKYYLQTAVEVVGEKDGRTETAHASEGGFTGLEFFESHPAEETARQAARRVKILLDAKPAPSGTLTIVMAAEAGGTMIHEAVGHGLEADLACNGLSVYQNKVGDQVASSLITVLDDGTMAAKRGSYVFDDEGTPSQKTVLIENGILKSYLVDRLSAMKFDLMATGNGRRESFRHKPIVRMTNTYIAPGKDDPAQILRDTARGIYVKGMGGGQVNTVTGDFVFAVTEAYLIENGKLGPAIRGATLVGNGPKVLKEIDRVGTDLGFATGTCGKDGQGAPVTDAQPTLRIPALTVGGEVPLETYFSYKVRTPNHHRELPQAKVSAKGIGHI